MRLLVVCFTDATSMYEWFYYSFICRYLMLRGANRHEILIYMLSQDINVNIENHIHSLLR